MEPQRRPSRRAFAPAHYESAASLMHHNAKTQRPHAKSRHGSSFSAIKMQRLPNRLPAAHESCAYRVCCVCHARSILSSSFSKLVLFETAQWSRLTGWLTSQRDLEDPNMRRLLASTTLIALAAGFSPVAMTSAWAVRFRATSRNPLQLDRMLYRRSSWRRCAVRLPNRHDRHRYARRWARRLQLSNL